MMYQYREINPIINFYAYHTRQRYESNVYFRIAEKIPDTELYLVQVFDMYSLDIKYWKVIEETTIKYFELFSSYEDVFEYHRSRNET